MIRTVLFCVAFVATHALCSTAAAQEPLSDPTGVYRCTGFNPDGSPYSAVVEIRRLENTYRVLWMLPDDTVVIGVGIVTGDVLAVSYFGGSPAIVVYRKAGDRLDGEWTVGGKEGAVYSETLTIMPGHPGITLPSEPPAKMPQPQRPVAVPTQRL